VFSVAKMDIKRTVVCVDDQAEWTSYAIATKVVNHQVRESGEQLMNSKLAAKTTYIIVLKEQKSSGL
jgi:hypothetical protein